MTETKVAPAVPAATLILVRGDASRLEVYLTRRSQRLKFLGGFYVFPGGRRDDEDWSEAALGRMKAGQPNWKANDIAAPERYAERLGYYGAAIREAFEEAGVLIARDQSGAPVRLEERMQAELKKFRAQLHERQVSFAQMLSELGLYYDLDALHWFAHWVTPATSPRRFDTQFFVAELPKGQNPEAFAGEVEEEFWITPAEGLERWKAGKLKMIPPTLASLDRLSRFAGLPELFDQLKTPRK